MTDLDAIRDLLNTGEMTNLQCENSKCSGRYRYSSVYGIWYMTQDMDVKSLYEMKKMITSVAPLE
jgi:hypothetical protein